MHSIGKFSKPFLRSEPFCFLAQLVPHIVRTRTAKSPLQKAVAVAQVLHRRRKSSHPIGGLRGDANLLYRRFLNRQFQVSYDPFLTTDKARFVLEHFHFDIAKLAKPFNK